ncbi:MAG TPA: (Fe-S)-binding protein [Gemmataceae bacterium]|nr:(Fe-S)-binding protein [Gemmataceae bacterium]
MVLKTETPTTSLPLTTLAPRQGAAIDYELFLDCVHCGLCTSACPTYVELGTEADSPRGRIYLMRAVTDGRVELNTELRRHLDLCLDCRACESACPSGVQYGKLIEPFRIHMAQSGMAAPLSFLQRFMLFHWTPYARRMRWLVRFYRLLQRTRLVRLIDRLGLPRWLPPTLRQGHAMMPSLQRHYGRLPEVLPAEGKRRARAALFTGCAADAFFPQTTLATIRVLQRNGCEVWIPRTQVCCGALHYHAGQAEAARRFAAANGEAFASDPANPIDSVDAIIVNAAGCGAMLKDYGHLVHDSPAAEKIASKVRDLSEFLIELGPIPPSRPLPLRAAYHDACHLCHAQQIRRQPRQLLEMIPGLELVSLAEPEICCGAAGSYNLTQEEMAQRLGQRKVKNICDARVQAVFTGNVGCLLQIGRYLRGEQPGIWVAHLADALWASYGGNIPELGRLMEAPSKMA